MSYVIVRYLDLDGIPDTMVAGNRACQAIFPSTKAAQVFWEAWISQGGVCFEIEHVNEDEELEWGPGAKSDFGDQ